MKKCRECKTPFDPPNSMASVCSPKCALQHVSKKRIKDQRKETKVRRERLKTLSDHHKDTQGIVNQYVRLRDMGKPCISCQRNTSAKRNAGHYLAVGSHPELRYEAETNIHSQCEHCNSWLSGNQQQYRIHLEAKIGKKALAILEGPHPPRQYRVEDLKAIQAEYRLKIKELGQ